MSKSVTVGSDESCDVPMAFTGVSSRHCRIFFDDGEIWVEDLDSTNGTYVDGRRVEPGHHQRLDRSSKLSLGGEATLTWEDLQAVRPSNAPEAEAQRAERNQHVETDRRAGHDRREPRTPDAEYEPRAGYAGFWKRVAAALLDSLIVVILAFGIGWVVGFVMANAGANASELMIVSRIIGGVVGWVYAAGFESSEYQATPGKMALGIEVTDLKGDPIGFGKATGRHFGKIISGLILLIGYFMAGFTEKKQALHDMMAGCLVINEVQTPSHRHTA